MLDRNVYPDKWKIADQFGKWTAQSAMRGWNQDNVNSALAIVDFGRLFDTELGPIGVSEFTEWHEQEIGKLTRLEFRTKNGQTQKLNVGWAAKMLAIYLKTTCYLAGFGRDGLTAVIHPPIDNILIRNLTKAFGHLNGVPPAYRFHIKDVDGAMYANIIGECRRIAAAQNPPCTLFEIERFWAPSPDS